MRNRTGPQRPRMNGDENATSRHARQASIVAAAPVARAGHSLANVQALKNNLLPRNALGEGQSGKQVGKDKESTETGLKRSRSSSLAAATAPQRVPLGPGRSSVQPTVQHRPPTTSRLQRPNVPRATQRIQVLQDPVAEVDDEDDDSMDVEQAEEVPATSPAAEDDSLLVNEQEIEDMVAYDDDEEFGHQQLQEPYEKPVRVWPEVSTARAARFRRELDDVKEIFQDEIDEEDTTMVSEYANEIFQYMTELEDDCMPNPDYMTGQSEINWSMRQTLVDWLLQVHLRYHMLPETLWIAINIVDRFLSKRVVSLVKLQLVGVTAMFIAAKYEEILAPSVEEFVFMTERGYTKEEILKGERIMLQTLEFKVSHYCSPYSWMRRISKADDYDIQTRTLSKFLTEVTLLDYRFLRVKPSMIAAIGMYTARKMLGGDWNEAFVYHSGFTEEHLLPGHAMLIQKLNEEGFHKQYVCRKYANKKFLKASVFAVDWAQAHLEEEGNMEGMVLME
ncbi:cyclin family protein [Abortiporus biennis]